MFEHTQVTGYADSWIAVPDGYQPTRSHEKTATGAKDALKLLKEANKVIGKLPKHPKDAPAKLYVFYSPVLLTDSGIKREVDQIKKNGERVGVFCLDTYDVRKR